jgi:hypothetical protein
MIRGIIVLIALAGALSPPAAGAERSTWSRWSAAVQELGPGQDGYRRRLAAYDYHYCRTAAATRLARAGIWNEGWAPRSLRPADRTAAEGADQCRAEQAALSALVRPHRLRRLEALVQQMSTKTVELVWRGPAPIIIAPVPK